MEAGGVELHRRIENTEVIENTRRRSRQRRRKSSSDVHGVYTKFPKRKPTDSLLCSNWKHENWLTLRLLDRKYPELALAFNAVRCEVCVINGKNCGKGLSLRQIYECGIGKIHGSIPIAIHQAVHALQFCIFDCTEEHRPGTDELPCGLHLRARIANEMEQFREHSLGGQQWKAQLMERVDAA